MRNIKSEDYNYLVRCLPEGLTLNHSEDGKQNKTRREKNQNQKPWGMTLFYYFNYSIPIGNEMPSAECSVII